MVLLRSGQETLIQTEKCSIIYGNYKGENAELFRCDRRLDDMDLRRFIEKNKCIVGFEEDDDAIDIRKIDGLKYLDYYRLYFRGGWYGRWMEMQKTDITIEDCVGVTAIVQLLRKLYPNGCDWRMKEDLAQHFHIWGKQKHRYLLKPYKNDLYRVLIDTTYGNDDYPVRIYVYRNIEKGGIIE